MKSTITSVWIYFHLLFHIRDECQYGCYLHSRGLQKFSYTWCSLFVHLLFHLYWIMQWKITVTLYSSFQTLLWTYYSATYEKHSAHSFFIALPREGRLSASTAGKWHGVQNSKPITWLQKYCMDGQDERHQRNGLWSVSNPTRDAVLVHKI